MDDSSRVDVVVSIKNLVHQYDSFNFRDGFSAGYELSQVASLAKFSDYIGIVFGIVDVIDFYYVLTVLQSFEYFYFGGKQILVNFAFYHFHIDDFDCNCLF